MRLGLRPRPHLQPGLHRKAQLNRRLKCGFREGEALCCWQGQATKPAMTVNGSSAVSKATVRLSRLAFAIGCILLCSTLRVVTYRYSSSKAAEAVEGAMVDAVVATMVNNAMPRM